MCIIVPFLLKCLIPEIITLLSLRSSMGWKEARPRKQAKVQLLASCSAVYLPDKFTEKIRGIRETGNDLSCIMNNAADNPVKLGETGKLFQKKCLF